MRYSAKPGNPSKSSIRQIKLYSVAVNEACRRLRTSIGASLRRASFRMTRLYSYLR